MNPALSYLAAAGAVPVSEIGGVGCAGMLLAGCREIDGGVDRFTAPCQ